MKAWLFRLLGKHPDAVVVTFASGDAARVAAMREEVRRLIPDRLHFDAGYEHQIRVEGQSVRSLYRQLRRALATRRIGAAAVLFDGSPGYAALRLAAFLLAPGKILAYNERGERQHLQVSSALASYLFWRGVPLDRIHLRPHWLAPWRRDRSVFSTAAVTREGRPAEAVRPRIGIVTPYPPFPLSHGGAVRMYHLLREAAQEYDLHVITFGNQDALEEAAPLLEFCSRLTFFPMPRYREPRWSSVAPPEAAEFCPPELRRAIDSLLRQWGARLVQIEYSQLAAYRGDVLVEHDITFDLYRQIYERRRDSASRLNLWRWRRFELSAVKRFRRVVTMSEKDGELLPQARTTVIPNGVDTSRFQPQPEPESPRLLFIGSFAHFPNVEAYRFFTGQVWPLLTARVPGIRLTVVAGRDPLLHWQRFTGSAAPIADPAIELLHFVSDVRPLYHACQLALAPTTVSAGTNLKVLEAMAMERTVVSTTSGCAGLGLLHGKTVWIADEPEQFAEGVAMLLSDDSLRRRIAQEARREAVSRFDWTVLGRVQRDLWRSLIEEQR